MNTIESKKVTSLRIKSGLYECIRERAKKENRSISNFLETLISEVMEYRKPNIETKQVLDQSLKDRPYLHYKQHDNIKDLLKDLMAD